MLMLILSAAVILLTDSSATNSGIFFSLPAGDQFYEYLMTRAPLAYVNIVGLVLKFAGPFGPSAPVFICLAIFVYCLYLALSKSEFSKRGVLARAVLISLFLAHPSVLWVLTKSPVDLFILSSLFAFKRGLLEINSASQGRGILLMALGSSLLFLSGSNGIGLTFALIVSAPVLLRSELFRTSLFGGTIILAFPIFVAFLGMCYLSWLFGVSLEQLAFERPANMTGPLDLIPWVPLLILVCPYVPVFGLNRISGFLERHSSFIVVPLAFISLFILRREPSSESFIGFLAVSAGLEFINKSHVRMKHFLLAGAFLACGWAIPLSGMRPLNLALNLGELPFIDALRGCAALGVLLLLRLYYLQIDLQKTNEQLRFPA